MNATTDAPPLDEIKTFADEHGQEEVKPGLFILASHVLMDYREIDLPRLLERVRAVHTPMNTPEGANLAFAATF